MSDCSLVFFFVLFVFVLRLVWERLLPGAFALTSFLKALPVRLWGGCCLGRLVPCRSLSIWRVALEQLLPGAAVLSSFLQEWTCGLWSGCSLERLLSSYVTIWKRTASRAPAPWSGCSDSLFWSGCWLERLLPFHFLRHRRVASEAVSPWNSCSHFIS